MVIFCGLTDGLASEIGAYAAPIGMLVGFGIPSAYMFARTQRGRKPIVFPYREVLKAFFAAALIAAAFLAIPDIGVAGVNCRCHRPAGRLLWRGSW